MIYRLFGVSHLDVVRASTFVASVVGKPKDAAKYSVPVVGGHSGATILPLLSQAKPAIVRFLRLLVFQRILTATS